MKNLTLIEEFNLSTTESGKIVVSDLSNPYGEGSESVVSVAVDLENNKEMDYKIHVPYKDIDNLISALQKAKASKEA
jgi:hypothetical protein